MFRAIVCFHNFSKTLLLFGIILTTLSFIQCKSSVKFPDYIKRCKKNDPHLDACFIRIIESLRPRFDKGIPEFGIPPADPLVIPEVVFFNGEKGGIKAKASSIIITGLKDFQLKSLSVNLKTLEFNSSLYVPVIHFEGNYDVNAKFSGFKLKGKGPFKGNATDVITDFSIKGKLVTFEGAQYMEIASARVDATFDKYHIKVDNLFKNKDTSEVFNRVINDPTAFPMETLRTMMNEFSSRKLIEEWNKMSRIMSFDEFFL